MMLRRCAANDTAITRRNVEVFDNLNNICGR